MRDFVEGRRVHAVRRAIASDRLLTPFTSFFRIRLREKINTTNYSADGMKI
jgi:hypothetical protein